MRKWHTLALSAFLLAGSASVAHAFCAIIDAKHTRWGDLTGDNRQMTVSDEYGAADYVLTGRVESLHRLGVDKDGFFEATNYGVAVLHSYKGHPQRLIDIYSENTTARFEMDVGKTYLMFVYRHDGQNFIDNCGWSDEIIQANRALQELEHRADFAKRPSHCWKGSKHVCVPDLRRYRTGERP